MPELTLDNAKSEIVTVDCAEKTLYPTMAANTARIVSFTYFFILTNDFK